MLLAVLTLALLLGAMLWALHSDNRAALWLAYAGFALEVFSLYVKTFGTLLDTSLFFLIAAVMVSVLAWAAYKLHQRKIADGGRRMTASRNKILLSLAILALAQTAVLAYMVIDRVRLLE